MPRDGPPTYRGHDIRYFYKITIATQRVKSKVQTLTVPIRVLPIPLIARQDELPVTVETNEELAPTNPFLEKREISELEISWHHLKVTRLLQSPYQSLNPSLTPAECDRTARSKVLQDIKQARIRWALLSVQTGLQAGRGYCG